MLSKLDKLGELESVAEQFKHDKAKQFVREQLSRGALKPDQEETTVTMLLSMEGDARKAFEDHLSALPSNELLAAEIGHDKDVNVDVNDELEAEDHGSTVEGQGSRRNVDIRAGPRPAHAG